jgi:hemoglobin-like flavoprotein
VLLKDEEDFAHQFYTNLFATAPELRNLFSNNMIEQGNMLTHMLRGIIYCLSRPDLLEMGLISLGGQHRDYGVKPEHYPIVKQVLLATIKERLKEFDAEVVQAWGDALELIISTMLRG